MRKVPSYKTGGNLVKGEPDKKIIKPTTIDRNKYKDILNKPLNQGDNFVTNDPESFVPAVLEPSGFNYYSGTIKGKDAVYKKGNNYYMYNEQLGDKGSSSYGLVNIGDLSEPKVQPAPVVTPTATPQVIDPMKQEGFNGMLKAQQFSYKNGGKVKGYFGGGDVDYDNGLTTDSSLAPSPSVPATSAYQASINAAQQKNLNKQKVKDNSQRNANIKQGANTAGRALGAYGTGYYAATPQENESEDIRAKGLSAVGQIGPIGGAIAGVAAIGDQIGEPIKKRSEALDESGNLKDPNAAKRNAFIGSMFSPSKSFATRREMNKAGYKGNKVFGWGKEYENYLEGTGKKKLQEERDAESKAIAEEARGINANRIQEAMAARDAGDTAYQVSAYNGPKQKDYAPLYADGGMIRGKGGPKSDSINAKVEEGSFIVPAENAHIAKELAAKVLRKAPSKKANLNQGGGVDVRLSDKEYLFSPSEKEELIANGIDIEKLAPNAKNELTEYLKCGGTVKGYAKGGEVDPKKELAKLNAQTAAQASARVAKAKMEAKAAKEDKAKLSKAADIKKAKAEYDRLNSGIKMLNKDYEDILAREKDKSKRAIGESDERINARKVEVLKKIEKLQEDANAVKSTYESSPEVRTDTKQYTTEDFPALNYGLKQEAKAADKLMSAEEEAAMVGALEAEEKRRKAPSKGTAKTAAKEVVEADVLAPKTMGLNAPQARGLAANTNNLYGDKTPEQILAANQAEQAKVDNSNVTPAPKAKYDYGNMLGTALNYGIPALQTGLGLRALKKAGDRPVDKLSPEYLNTISQTAGDVQAAREQAKFGFTGEQLAQANMENAALTNTGRAFARNIAGGSGAAGLNAERSILNDSFGRALSTRVQDKNLQLAKQQDAFNRQQGLNAIVADKQDRLRSLFGDTLSTYQQNQQSGAALLGAGLSNLVGAARYSQEQNAAKGREALANSWSNGLV